MAAFWIALAILLALAAAWFFVGNYFFDIGLRRADKPFLRDNPDLPIVAEVKGERFLRLEAETAAWYEKADRREVALAGFDGQHLAGTMFFCPEPSAKWMILVHGYVDSRASMFSRGMYFQRHGFNLLAVDCRGCGESGGNHMTMGWLDRLDIAGWARVVAAEYPEAQIVLHGVSMGGAAVMMTAGEKLPDNVKCVVEDCGYTSVWDIFAFQLRQLFRLPPFPVLYAAASVAKLRAGFSWKRASAVLQLQKTRLPVLFIHGTEDTFVPFQMVYTLYDAAPKAKELWIVEGSTHGTCFFDGPEEYVARTVRFAQRHMQ